MAKIFGYNYHSSTKYPHLNLADMKNAFKINFQLYKLIKRQQGGVGLGILNKYDCKPMLFKNSHIDLVFMGKIFNTKEDDTILIQWVKKWRGTS